MLILTLVEIISYLISVIVALVIVQFIVSLLVAFNVVSFHNQYVSAIYRAVNALLDPLLAPIRRVLPDTGAIDLSPLALIVLLNIIKIILGRLV